MDKTLYGETQPVTVDFIPTAAGGGFKITSALNTGNSCGSCSC